MSEREADQYFPTTSSQEEQMTKILPLLGLNGIELSKGSHASRDAGVCAMEAVAWLAGEPHSDAPKCACPALTAYVIKLNDNFEDADRQKLKQLLPRLIGTRDGREVQRAQLLAFRAGTVFVPLALDTAGFKVEAENLRKIEFGDWSGLESAAWSAQAAAWAERSAAWSAQAAAWAAEWAAESAARSAAWAAESAARSAEAASAASAQAAADVKEKIVTEALKALEDAINLK